MAPIIIDDIQYSGKLTNKKKNLLENKFFFKFVGRYSFLKAILEHLILPFSISLIECGCRLIFAYTQTNYSFA